MGGIVKVKFYTPIPVPVYGERLLYIWMDKYKYKYKYILKLEFRELNTLPVICFPIPGIC